MKRRGGVKGEGNTDALNVKLAKIKRVRVIIPVHILIS